MKIILKDVDVYFDGKAIIQAKTLVEMLGSMTADDVTFSEQHGSIKVQCGRSKFHAPVMDAEKFPNITVTFPETTIRVSGLALISKQVVSIVSEADSNPAFQGVQMRFTPGITTALSSDGMRIAKAKIEDSADEFLDLFVPERALKILVGIVRAGDSLFVGTVNNCAVFQTSAFVFTTRLTDATLSNVEKMMDKIVPVDSITVNSKEFARATDACITMVSGVDSCVNVTLKNRAMVLSVDNENGSTEIEVAAENAVDLQGKVYHYRPDFIFDFLRSCAGMVKVDFDARGIMRLRSDSGDYVVMPRTAARVKEVDTPEIKEKKTAPKKEKTPKSKKGKAVKEAA
jgi:DNA polymerase III sliding clamp (beta) subunit (PCNA family)